jgi:hypothetical protein
VPHRGRLPPFSSEVQVCIVSLLVLVEHPGRNGGPETCELVFPARVASGSEKEAHAICGCRGAEI